MICINMYIDPSLGLHIQYGLRSVDPFARDHILMSQYILCIFLYFGCFGVHISQIKKTNIDPLVYGNTPTCAKNLQIFFTHGYRQTATASMQGESTSHLGRHMQISQRHRINVRINLTSVFVRKWKDNICIFCQNMSIYTYGNHLERKVKLDTCVLKE